MRSDPGLQFWLQAEGSLTARLRQFGPVQVQVQRQGHMALWVPEQQDVRQRGGYVREVVLLLNGRPAVWARSVTSMAASRGPWRALQGLGTRPLAELLFAARPVARACTFAPPNSSRLTSWPVNWRTMCGPLTKACASVVKTTWSARPRLA